MKSSFTGVAEEKLIVIHGLEFLLIQMESRWPGKGDIFAMRKHADEKWHEEFCGFRNFTDAHEQLEVDDRVADMAGFLHSEAPHDRPILAIGYVAWKEETGCVDEDGIESGPCGGQYPFVGEVKWRVLEGWSGWVYVPSGLSVCDNPADTVRVTRWKEAS